MGFKINSLSPPVLCKFPTKIKKTVLLSSSFSDNKQHKDKFNSTAAEVPITESSGYTVSFKTERACKLGISRYPDFEYNAEGGKGTGSGAKVTHDLANNELFVWFDLETLYIPPLTSSTTKFLGLPLPPFLNIDIVPIVFQGNIDQESGKVDLEFEAKFLFSAGSVYKVPPLLVKTVLTSEESKGSMKCGRGKRLDEGGKCTLVGVATVDPTHDFLLNSFLALPTECLAVLNALISICSSS